MPGVRRIIGDGGFALVEALASLVIVGMISLMLIEGVGTGRRVWERIDTRQASAEAIEGAQSALRDRIEQAYLATLFYQNPPAVDFDGKADMVTFLANPPTQAVLGRFAGIGCCWTPAANWFCRQ